MTAAAAFDSEYVTLAEFFKELRSLWQVKAFMMTLVDCKIPVYEDNETAIKMDNDRFSSQRMQHIDVKMTCSTRRCGRGSRHHQLRHVWRQYADALTKALGVKAFEMYRDFLLNVHV